MKVFKQNLVDFTEVDEEKFEKDFADGKIETKIVKEGKTAEEIFNELKTQGVEVKLHNGVYCKVIYNTFEAINPIPDKVIYVEKE